MQRQLSQYGAQIAEKLSLDISKDGYYALRNAIMDKDAKGRRRVNFYYYEPILEELVRLEDRPMKIDHPYQGAKDVADSLAGVVYNCERLSGLQTPVAGVSINVRTFGQMSEVSP